MKPWWEWRITQWWWYRQYKRADRKAFKRERQEKRQWNEDAKWY